MAKTGPASHRPPDTGLAVGQILDPKWSGRSTLTVEEVAEILGLSRDGAYAAANKGLLPVVRVGRRLIIPRHALERMLDVSLPGAATA